MTDRDPGVLAHGIDPQTRRLAPDSVWLKRRKWPSACPGWVFLVPAVHQLGQVMFPNVWSIGPPYLFSLLYLDEADSAKADGLREDRNRLERVQRLIAARCAKGSLEYALRDYEGCEPPDSGYPKEWWITEGEFLAGRFRECRLDPDNPSARSPVRGKWIFLEQVGLQRLLAELSRPKPRAQKADSVTQFLAERYPGHSPPGRITNAKLNEQYLDWGKQLEPPLNPAGDRVFRTQVANWRRKWPNEAAASS